MAKKEKVKKQKKKYTISKSAALTFGSVAAVYIGFRISVLAGFAVSGILLACLIIWHWANILTLFGQRAYAQGKNNKALAYLKAGHEHPRAGAANSSAYAYILLRCGRAEDARIVANYALLNKKLSESDKNQIRQILSLICYKLGDYDEATEMMEQIFENYKSTTVYGTLGYYKILANSEDMYAFNEEAYEYNDSDKVIIDNMVILALMQGDAERAQALSKKSIDAGNKGVEIFYHAAQAEEALGNNEQALEYYLMAQSCTRSFMTTVPEAEIEAAIERLDKEA